MKREVKDSPVLRESGEENIASETKYIEQNPVKKGAMELFE